MEGKEISDYPENLNIKWKNNKRTFYYKIVKEGIYPREYILCQTKKPNQYPIPHGYIVQTSWNQNMCPVQFTSNKFPSDAATLLCNNINPESNTQISGVFLFGLHLKFVQQNRKKVKKRSLKSVDNISRSTLIKKAKTVTKQTLNDFTNMSKLYYNPEDHKNWDENTTAKKQKNEAIVMAIDKGQISRNMYRDLAAIESELPREWAISDQRMQINKEMRNRIKITTINMPSLGGHKLKVLQFFDLGKVLPLSRVKIIRRLWDEFHELYVAMRNPATDSETFKKNAEYWLRLFLTPSIGTPNDENFFNMFMLK
ncbi:13968_t:CDS:2 [Rhizophagus irregularis]|nr:13968_t:CDS:2 [Rhizophagus irregularis]